MRIETEINPVVVEIDGKEYEVAAKTVGTAEKMKAAEDSAIRAKKAQYEMWLAQMEVLIGRAAVKELFPNGKGENLDRMEAIFYGIVDAFNYNGREARTARTEDSVSEARAIADALNPLADVLALLGKADTGHPTIKRPQ